MSAGASARARWNERHRNAAADASASAWLAEHRGLLEPLAGGRALDVACGRGRNALYLARLGFEVDAVDVSDVAVAAVERCAAALGARVNAIRVDLEREPLPSPPYAAIVNVDYLQRSLFGALRDALIPGGLLVVETFSHGHPRMNPAYTLGPGELLAAFGDLEVLAHHEADGRAGLVARGR